MAITAAMVKELRETTGAGMMDCKKVLVETNGDMEKAVAILREKGLAKAAKKADRLASEGLAGLIINDSFTKASLIEVNSETDFVAKNEEFVTFANKLAEIVANENPKNVEELKGLEYEDGKTVEAILTEKIATIGENMSIRRFERIETEGTVEGYIHANGKIGVIVEVEGDNREVAKELCLQITALNPEYRDVEDIPAERVEKEKEVLAEQAKEEGKPEEIAKKIAEGRLGKFYEEVTLVNQVYVKDSSKKIKDILKENNTNVVSYYRYERGEGLEKREDDFAKEVMEQLNN